MNSTKSCQNCPIWKKSLFKDLNIDLVKWLENNKTSNNYQKGDYIFLQGSAVTGLFCHADGLSKVSQRDLKDNVRFSRLVFPADTSGHRSIFIEHNYKGSNEVISEELSACFISKEAVSNLMNHDTLFAKNLIIRIAQDLSNLEEEQAFLREKTVRGRLALFIYRLTENYGEAIDEGQSLIKTAISKRDIAKLLLVANETVIRLMTELKNEKIIDYYKKKILVKDLKRLKEFSEF